MTPHRKSFGLFSTICCLPHDPIPTSIAYFPLFPLVIKAVHGLNVIPLSDISFFLNIIFSLLATFLIYKLARIDYSERESFFITALWLLFPSSYFLITGYPDALFALLVALSLYLGRKKNWLLAGLASGLLALTKPYGFLMLPVLFFEYLIDNGWNWKIFWKKIDWLPLLLPLLSVLTFVAFNYEKFQQPFAFLIAQRTWGRAFGNPFISLLAEARDNFLTSGGILAGGHAPYLWYLFSFLFFIAALIISCKQVRKTYLLFSIMVMLTAFMSGTLTSWGRYMFLAFPVFIGPALYLSKKKYLAIIYFIVSSAALLIFASFFVRCYPFE